MRFVLKLLFLSAVVSGCSGLSLHEPKAEIYERNGITVAATQSEATSTYFKDQTDTDRYCLAPGPDVTLTASEGLVLRLPAPKSSETVGGEESEGALGLGGRSPAVLITRELMYRACELSLNVNANKDETIRIYERFLQAIVAISKQQTERGVASVSAQPASLLGGAGAANGGSTTGQTQDPMDPGGDAEPGTGDGPVSPGDLPEPGDGG